MQKDKPNWQSSLNPDDASLLYPWLNNAGSFMQRLAKHGIDNAKVHVLREDYLQPEEWEYELLQLPNEPLLIREVCISSDATVWMYARTVFSANILAEKRELSSLENRSLGSVLFQDPAIKRGLLEFIYANPQALWKDFLPYSQTAWIRRSLFMLQQPSLLLSEIFMPELEKLCGIN